MWTIFKVFTEFVTNFFFFFILWFLGFKACRISAPGPGIEPIPPVPKGKILTPGPPGESLKVYSMKTESLFSLLL